LLSLLIVAEYSGLELIIY